MKIKIAILIFILSNSVDAQNYKKILLQGNKYYNDSLYKQAEENSKDYEPIVVLKRNNHKPLVLVDAEYFVKLHTNTKVK